MIILEQPYFMSNEAWYYFDEEEWKYKLTKEAPPKAVKSYEEHYALLKKAMPSPPGGEKA